jgi:hypothetical protein
MTGVPFQTGVNFLLGSTPSTTTLGLLYRSQITKTRCWSHINLVTKVRYEHLPPRPYTLSWRGALTSRIVICLWNGHVTWMQEGTLLQDTDLKLNRQVLRLIRPDFEVFVAMEAPRSSETSVSYITLRLTMEAARSSETSAFYITTRLNIEAAGSSVRLVSYRITIWRHNSDILRCFSVTRVDL